MGREGWGKVSVGVRSKRDHDNDVGVGVVAKGEGLQVMKCLSSSERLSLGRLRVL